MEPRRLLTFRAVAHERSFSRAARALALSQPSVSNQVAALEREVGVRLLDRQPGGLRLTPEGEILLDHADAIAARLDLARTQLAAAADESRTRLRVGAFPTALAGLIPAAVERVRRHHPAIKATSEEGGGGPGGRGRSGAVPLGVPFQASALPPPEPAGLERLVFMRDHFKVALA